MVIKRNSAANIASSGVSVWGTHSMYGLGDSKKAAVSAGPGKPTISWSGWYRVAGIADWATRRSGWSGWSGVWMFPGDFGPSGWGFQPD